jgi:hypothetical protein
MDHETETAMKAITHQNDAWEAWRPGVESRMLVSARNGAAQLCMFEQWVGPGVGAPTHRHPVEEAHMTLTAGQSLIVPAGRLHGFRNRGSTRLHIHAVLASPIFEATPEGATEVTRRWEVPSSREA